MPRKIVLCLAAAVALAGCKRESADPASAPSAQAPADSAPSAPVSSHAFSPELTTGDFAELVKTLASDAFEGRGPGTPGEEKTVTYIRDQMQRIGLQPGNGDSWFQDVPMVETTADPAGRTGSCACTQRGRAWYPRTGRRPQQWPALPAGGLVDS